jgi:hypothetical protein
MLSLVVLGLSSVASGAAIEKRDPVPAGYVAAPYYPCKSCNLEFVQGFPGLLQFR